MIRLDLKNYNTTLIDNEKKYQFYYQVKYEYFTGEEIFPSNQRQKRLKTKEKNK